MPLIFDNIEDFQESGLKNLRKPRNIKSCQSMVLSIMLKFFRPRAFEISY